jgi:hypothetical protein
VSIRRLFSLLTLLAFGLVSARTGHTEPPSAETRDEVQAVLVALRSAAHVDSRALKQSRAAEVRRLAQQAYVWGWPLVYVHNCRATLGMLKFPGRSGGLPVAPPNELCMLTDYIAPTQNVVTCPNHDVVYGFGILDLGLEPVVLQVPDFGDRFWLYQLGDQRTDGFANVGKLYGTKPGAYLVVGPDWQGEKPEGIVEVFRCPTRIGYCLPRVFLDDTAADREAIQLVLSRIMAYPLTRWDGAIKTCDWSKYRWYPRLGSTGSKRSRWVTPETFFDSLAEVLSYLPPLAGEEALYAEVRELLAKSEHDAELRRMLVETAVAAEAELVAPLFEFANLGTKLPHHWTTIHNGAAFGTDYLTRTAVAKSNVFVNRRHETKYFYQDLDVTGARLNGERNYVVTFAAGSLPPTKDFWSITLYDEHHGFHANELGRYSVGTKSKQLTFNADGSLTIYVQATPPSADRINNWLPAPRGKFSLYLRAYTPEAAILDGRWTPPAVVPVGERTLVDDVQDGLLPRQASTDSRTADDVRG